MADNEEVLQAIAILSRTVAGLGESMTGLRVDLMARMDRLQDRLGELREDVNLALGSSLNGYERLENLRGEPRNTHDILMTLMAKVRTLEARMRDLGERDGD